MSCEYLDSLASSLNKLVTLYCTGDCQKQKHSPKQQSRSVLLLYACCAMLDAVARVHPDHCHVMIEYAPPLRSDNLYHLLLPDKDLVVVAKCVFDYLNSFRSSIQGLFDLSSEHETLQFAEKYASQSCELQQLHALVQEEATRAEEEYPAKVQNFQEQEQSARNKLVQLSSARARLPQCARACSSCDWCKLNRSFSAQESEVVQLARQPSALVQPLPKNRSKALQVVFFMQMPVILRSMANVAMLAQHGWHARLYENPPLDPKVSRFDWAQHLQNHSTSMDGTELTAHSPTELIAYSPEGANFHGSRIVHYPDNIPLKIAWKYNMALWDPFVPNNTRKDKLFMRQFCVSGGYPQWMLNHTPENEVLARQSERPPHLTKLLWWTFGTLRSEKELQLRKISSAFNESEQGRLLDLCHPATMDLLIQALTQLGEMEQGEIPYCLLWKKDLGEEGFLKSLCNRLKEQANRLLSNMRNHKALIAILTIANYIGEFSNIARDIISECKRVTKAWYDQVTQEARNANTDNQRLANLRKLRAEFAAYQIISYKVFPRKLNIASMEAVVRLRVVIAEMVALAGPLSDDLSRWLNTAMIRLEKAVVSLCGKRDGHDGLTVAVKGVLPWIDGRNLNSWHDIDVSSNPFKAVVKSWHQVSSSPFFKAETQSGDKIEVNIRTGIVLQNGIESGRLPKCIREHDLFKLIFGPTADPPVMQILETMFRSRDPMADCFYSFGIDVEDRLVVNELRHVDDDDGALLIPPELMPFPVPLLEGHSHWLRNTRRDIDVRHLDYQQRNPLFVAKLCDQNGDSDPGIVRKVVKKWFLKAIARESTRSAAAAATWRRQWQLVERTLAGNVFFELRRKADNKIVLPWRSTLVDQVGRILSKFIAWTMSYASVLTTRHMPAYTWRASISCEAMRYACLSQGISTEDCFRMIITAIFSALVNS